MNKIIAAFDSLNASESTMHYATYLWREYNMHIVAAFLEDIAYHGKAENGLTQPYEHDDWSSTDTYIKKEQTVRKAFTKKVHDHFSKQGVHYTIHHDELIAQQSLARESQFADMILINQNESFSATDKSKPSHFLQTLLTDSDCPVMIVPGQFKPIDKFILTYDGSAESTYAIRLFSYLFTLQPSQQVEVMMVTDDEHSNHFPEQHLLKELLTTRYPIVQSTIIKNSHNSDKLLEYLQSQKQSCMAVMGSYNRSTVSRWLHKSAADSIIAEANIPVVIAHK
jgi:hypothetical protein